MQQIAIKLSDAVTVQPQGVTNGVAFYADTSVANTEVATKVTVKNSAPSKGTLTRLIFKISSPNLCTDPAVHGRTMVLDINTVTIEVALPKLGDKASRTALVAMVRALVGSTSFATPIVDMDHING